MASVAHITYTPEEYLAIERKAEFKSEYVNGEIYAMSGASKEHNIITGNIYSEIRNQFKRRPCEVYITDMRVRVPRTNLYTYPDVAAVCGGSLFDDSHVDTLTNPTVIVEVLSPSTETYDKGDKFAHYLKLPSLQEYVLVSQDKVRVEHYARRGAEWVYTQMSTLDEVLVLGSIECAIALQDIYEKVEFVHDTNDAENEETGGADGRR
jgi:Uma2 family endonuclease